MSRIEDLIAAQCPAGVQYVALSDLLDYEQPGRYLVESTAYSDSYSTPVLTAGQTFILGYTNETNGIYDASPDSPVVIFDDFTTAFKWVDFSFKAKSSAMKILTPKAGVVLRYVWFAMQTIRYSTQEHARQWIGKYSSFRIPVPPLEVQREIVTILDQFTQLEAELEARQRQYEHYRSSLVRATQMGAKYSLGEIEDRGIVKLGRGKVISKITLAERPGDYPVYSSSGAGSGEFGRYGLYMFEDERITWSVDGGGRFFYRHPHRFSVTNVSGWMTVDTSVFRVKYLYYVLTVLWEAQSFDYTRKAHPSVIRDVYEIAIPSLETQDEVTALLDKFDALVNDIGVGLPAELTARRTQYEYYRNELLAFKERS